MDQAELKRVLHYDPETGVFTWRVSLSWRGKIGAEAGNIFRRYRHIRIHGKLYRVARLAWLYTMGEWPPLDVDHVDGDGLNNRWRNLREATVSQNLANARRRKDNTSGYKGVFRYPMGFRARIYVGGKTLHLGCRATAEEAHALYVAAARRHFGEFARVE